MLVNVSTSSLKKKSTCGQISLVFHRQYSFAVFKRLELYFKTIGVFSIDSVVYYSYILYIIRLKAVEFYNNPALLELHLHIGGIGLPNV